MTNHWEPRPVPPVTPETEYFWEGCAEGELRLPHCTDCNTDFYYPRAVCPDCTSQSLDWTIAEGIGTIYSYSVMSDFGDWPDPHILAYVDLPEGVRIMTNIVDCDPAALSIGTPVEVKFIPTEDDSISVPVFQPR